MRRAARKRTTRQLEQVFKALQGDLLDEQGACFDPATSRHDHFVCERCGRNGRSIPAASSTGRPGLLVKQGEIVTTHVHGLCRGGAARRRTSRPQRREARKGLAKSDVDDGSGGASQLKESPNGIPR